MAIVDLQMKDEDSKMEKEILMIINQTSALNDFFIEIYKRDLLELLCWKYKEGLIKMKKITLRERKREGQCKCWNFP